jgi:ketosteroid isomerase-like protein
MDVNELGRRLVDLCREGRDHDALDLYSPDAVSVEAGAMPEVPQVATGKDAIRRKGEWWTSHNEVHQANVKGPFPNGDRFAVIFDYEITPKAGPYAGKRTKMEEVGVYTVEDGRIVREEFFYPTGA